MCLVHRVGLLEAMVVLVQAMVVVVWNSPFVGQLGNSVAEDVQQVVKQRLVVGDAVTLRTIEETAEKLATEVVTATTRTDSKLSFVLNDFIYDFSDSEYQQNCKLTSVKGRIKNNIKFWEQIGTNEYILQVIKYGYVLPFVSRPNKVNSNNNKSARDNSTFVAEAIAELIVSKAVSMVDYEPEVVNPLTVAINAKGKKRLVLDLREVNPFLWKEKIKFDDWKVAQDYLDIGGYMYCFDLKSGYHHIEIHEDYHKYLGFAWTVNSKKQYYIFTVLPFGCPLLCMCSPSY
jgi:hypothetical protein